MKPGFTRRQKIVGWIVCAVLLVAGAGIMTFGEVTGIAPGSRALPQEYARAQRLGLSLTADDLRALDQSPSAPEAEVEARLKVPRLNNYLATPWLPEAPPDLRKTRAELTPVHRAEARRLVKEIESGAIFRAERGWGNPWVNFVNFGSWRNAIQLLLAHAGALAAEGKRDDAVRHLSAARRLVLQFTQHPSLIDGLYRIDSFRDIRDTAQHLAEIDRGGALNYAQASLGGWDFNLAYHLQATVYGATVVAREMPALDNTKIALGYSVDWIETSWTVAKADEMPSFAINRAALTEDLRFFIAIFETRDSSGRFGDLGLTERVMARELSRLESRSYLYKMGSLNAVFDLAAVIRKFRRADYEHALLQDWVKILAFERANQRWPRSLAEAGVTPRPDPYAPGEFTQYRADASGASLWMRGEDGLDHGGFSRVPAFLDALHKPGGDWSLGLPLGRIGGPHYPLYYPSQR